MLFLLLSVAGAQPSEHDLVIAGGRVMDPESGLDAVRHIGIRDGKLAAISERPLTGKIVLQAAGRVVAPGFIDLHSHGQTNQANEYQAHDGVTTALELEVGVPAVGEFLKSRANNSILNFGATSSHGAMRQCHFASLLLKLLRGRTPHSAGMRSDTKDATNR